jgi:hypothetical protein
MNYLLLNFIFFIVLSLAKGDLSTNLFGNDSDSFIPRNRLPSIIQKINQTNNINIEDTLLNETINNEHRRKNWTKFFSTIIFVAFIALILFVSFYVSCRPPNISIEFQKAKNLISFVNFKAFMSQMNTFCSKHFFQFLEFAKYGFAQSKTKVEAFFSLLSIELELIMAKIKLSLSQSCSVLDNSRMFQQDQNPESSNLNEILNEEYDVGPKIFNLASFSDGASILFEKNRLYPFNFHSGTCSVDVIIFLNNHFQCSFKKIII